MTISWPTNTRTITNEIRDVIGREVIFSLLEEETPCPVCDLDPVTNVSTDSFCPVCSGVYWIPTIVESGVTAHVTWKAADDLDWYSGGQMFKGDCRIQIEYTPEHLEMISKTQKIIVDSKILQIDTVIPRGVPELNRVIITLLQEDKEDE